MNTREKRKNDRGKPGNNREFCFPELLDTLSYPRQTFVLFGYRPVQYPANNLAQSVVLALFLR